MKQFPTRELMAAAFPRGASIVEVGVQRGDFAHLILSLAQPRRLVLVDCWSQIDSPHPLNAVSKEQAEDNLAHVQQRFAGRPEVEIRRNRSLDEARNYPAEHFDIVYLDPCHEEIAADLAAWWPLVRRGGLLAGHDYVDRPQEGFPVKPAVDAFLKQHRLSLDALTTDEWPSWGVLKP